MLVADPQGQILDCKEYLAPIVTPHEALLAWTPGAQWDPAAYRLDFEEAAALGGATGEGPPAAAAARRRGGEPRFSLLDGAYHADGDGSGSEGQDGEGPEGGNAAAETRALAVHAARALQVAPAPGGRSDLVTPASAAEFFVHKRSWQGVETPLAGAEAKEPAAAVEGRSGRAAGYTHETG